MTAIGRALIKERAWDEAFELAQRHNSDELLLELIGRSADSLLAEGRVSTLEEWLNYAAERRTTDEILDYAEAEVAFRNALHTKAEVLGTELQLASAAAIASLREPTHALGIALS